MASFRRIDFLVTLLVVLLALFDVALAGKQKTKSMQDQMVFQYHGGPLLSGKISVNLIWYGNFTASQRAIVSDFFLSLSTPESKMPKPNVATWWNIVEVYYDSIKPKKAAPLTLLPGSQILDENCSLGKSLETKHIKHLAAKGDQKDAINVVLTAADVTVDGFCSETCGTHGSSTSSNADHVNGKSYHFAYIWVGNSETQCPGECAWPFHQPIYGPQNPPLIPPNNDVGMDGIIINIGSLLAATATNPFDNGYYQGPSSEPLEAASACPGIYASGYYPGYPGKLLVDSTTGASYNANGADGKEFLLPSLYNPSTAACATLV